MTRCAHHASPRVRAQATEVQPVDRPGVASPAHEWPPEEQLYGREIAVEDVAASQAETRLQVRGCQRRSVLDGCWHVRGVLAERRDDPVREALALGVPQ